MKVKEGFVLRKIPGMNMVLPAGENLRNTRDAVILNDTAALIYEKLRQGEDERSVAGALCTKYGIDLHQAEADVKDAVSDFIEAGLISA